MPTTRIACPRCQAVLSSRTPLPPGRLLKCARCAARFRVAAPKAAQETKAPPPATRKAAAQAGNGTAAASTRIVCPACQAALRFPGVVPPERAIRCARCATIFRRGRPASLLAREGQAPKRAAKPTQLKPTQPAPQSGGAGIPARSVGTRGEAPPPGKAKVTKLAGVAREEHRPTIVLTCAGCQARIRIHGRVPPGLAIPCPRCHRRLTAPTAKKTVLAPAKPATLLLPPAKPTQLAAKAPVKKTQLAPAQDQKKPTRLHCPACKAVLSFAGPIPAGKPIKCPKCTRTFRLQPRARPAEPPRTVKSISGSAAPPRTAKSVLKPEASRVRQRPERPARRSANRWLYAAGGALLVVVALAAFTLGKSLWSHDIPASEWVEFAPPAGDCRVLLPGQPVVADSAAPAVATRKYTVEAEITTRGFTGVPTGSIVKAFMLEVSDWTEPGSFDRVYAATRDNVLRHAGGRLVSERDVATGRHRGKEFVIEPDAEGAVIGRFFLVGPRSYLLLAAGAKLTAEQGDAERFLGSLKID